MPAGAVVTRVARAFYHLPHGVRDALRQGTPVAWRRDPDNRHDSNAISLHLRLDDLERAEMAALVEIDGTSWQIGHVPRGMAAVLAPRLDAGKGMRALVAEPPRDGEFDVMIRLEGDDLWTAEELAEEAQRRADRMEWEAGRPRRDADETARAVVTLREGCRTGTRDVISGLVDRLQEFDLDAPGGDAERLQDVLREISDALGEAADEVSRAARALSPIIPAKPTPEWVAPQENLEEIPF